jgi:hypothetical protein
MLKSRIEISALENYTLKLKLKKTKTKN